MTPTNRRHIHVLIIPVHRLIAAATHPVIIVNQTTLTHQSFEDCLKKLFVGFLVASRQTQIIVLNYFYFCFWFLFYVCLLNVCVCYKKN